MALLPRREMPPDVRISADVTDMSRRAAGTLIDLAADAVRRRGRCLLALAGGQTPRALYRLLATEFRSRVDWPSVQVFWSDERYVPADDPRSNYRMARETLLDFVPCPPGNVHPMPTGFAVPDEAAANYAATLRTHVDGIVPILDLVLLGLGEDGHTASLFPHARALAERSRWVAAVEAPVDPPTRLTLTVPVLLAARMRYVLAAGSQKIAALHAVLANRADPDRFPAACLRAADGPTVWWADRAAAGDLAE